MKHPIDSIQWVDADLLSANDWNPNHVFGPEMRLLELSLLKNGWIQPILVSRTPPSEPGGAAVGFTIIDGFHRSVLARTSQKVRELTGGRVPCAVLEISEAERMLLTVRINRAKGSHAAVKMHELVERLVGEHGLSREYVAESIGATPAEVDLLLQESVFKALKIDEHEYSKAWTPRPTTRKGKG